MRDPQLKLMSALQGAKQQAAVRAAAHSMEDELSRSYGRASELIGEQLLMVSASGVKSFKDDDSLKAYGRHNNLFTDVFGGADLKWPVLFMLSRQNPPGVKVQSLGSQLSAIRLGPGYSLGELTAAIGYVLQQQGVRVARGWFMELLWDEGVDPRDPSFSSFWPVTEAVGLELGSLLRTRSILVATVDDGLDGLAPLLGVRRSDGMLMKESDGGIALAKLDGWLSDITPVNPAKMDLAASMRDRHHMLIQLTAPPSTWAQLPAGCFDSIETVLAITRDASLAPAVSRLPAFAGWQVRGR